MDLHAARVAALKMTAHIDTMVTAKLLKFARQHGVTFQEAVVLVESWKRAARQKWGHARRRKDSQ